MASRAKNIFINPRALARVVETVEDWRAVRREIGHLSLGFVPTMGALHQGHIELVKRAKAENDIAIASVFVNPTQFGPNEDFSRYPRQLEKDVQLVSAQGVSFVFAPKVDQIYRQGHRTYVVPDGNETQAEGQARPGHFRGVATVVTKLFNIIQPTRAYFGQKDAMQCVIIKQMIEDLNQPVEPIICPTIREPDGLAMSSRNAYLDPEERKAAPVVYRALKAVEAAYQAAMSASSSSSSSPISAADLRARAMDTFAKEPLVHKVEYVSIGSKRSMAELDTVDAEGAVVSVAVRLGKVRLIDNIFL